MKKVKEVILRENGVLRIEKIEIEVPDTAVPIKLPAKRTFTDAIGPARLSASWKLGADDINDDLVQYLSILRDKARSLEITSDHVRRFLQLAESNVVGSDGFRLQVKARVSPGGEIDKGDSALAERLWTEYGKKKNINVDRRTNLRQIENLIVRGVLRDGEVFIRKIVQKRDRRFPLKLQIIPPEWIDERFNREGSETSNEVIMGIEFNGFGAPVAYWILDEENTVGGSRGRTRIPADQMIHIFIPTRERQARGYSALVSSIFNLKMIDGVKEASTTNFRVGASKMGWFTRTAEGVEYVGEGKDAEGNILTQVAPGQFEMLPVGVDFKEFAPDFPAEQFEAFMKSMIRSISAGWGVSYSGLANDYSEVSYSSARVAQLEERELWKKIQKEVVDQFLDDLYEEWLTFAILTQTLPVPESRFDKFNEKKFIGRTWTWVDPQKEVTAKIDEIENGLNSRTRICAEQGLDFDEVAEELAHEQGVADAKGITFGKSVRPAPEVTLPDSTDEETPVS